MTAKIDGGPVAPHVQAFADEIARRWGFTHLLTYPGHQPDQRHALDCFQTRAVMLQLADWCTRDDVIDRYGLDYVIFNVDESTVGGEIYNREISRSWRHMGDRGSPTANHHDHVHVSFVATAPASQPSSQEDDMFDPATDGQRLRNVETQMGQVLDIVKAVLGAEGRAEDAPVNTVIEQRLARLEGKVDQLLSK